MFVHSIDPHAHLHRDADTGLAWVENKYAGIAHTAHPNTAGTVAHARALYGTDAVLVKVRGFVYNLADAVAPNGPYDAAAAAECRCKVCRNAKA